tara:strand:- start:8241 stop:8972 length:732 start_codon:yes stop_codon:yes gene_type:complete
MKIISLKNKWLDLLKFDKYKLIREELLKLSSANNHNNKLSENKTDSNHKYYDYGCGYFYQSSDQINLTGLRASRKRIQQYGVENELKDSTVLDIGTNTGFFLLDLKNSFKEADGIEYNPILIEIANRLKLFLKIENINFINDDFLEHDFKFKEYDLILSLANHSTFDKGIQDTNSYFDKCYKLLKKNGKILIEGHHPNYERVEEFNEIIKKLIKKFDYKKENEGIIYANNFYDNKRKFFLLKK